MKIPFTSIFTINKRGKWETLVKIRVNSKNENIQA